ncbi:uncharacterized protein LOC143189774 [Rhynchophorus ferrugineus]|uniref:uncharacterized protein LOC143189774 n=1 Tax=Rhynchophorus ferrugineus TaxID=354439 RepID=UPI003FCD68DB
MFFNCLLFISLCIIFNCCQCASPITDLIEKRRITKPQYKSADYLKRFFEAKNIHEIKRITNTTAVDKRKIEFEERREQETTYIHNNTHTAVDLSLKTISGYPIKTLILTPSFVDTPEGSPVKRSILTEKPFSVYSVGHSRHIPVVLPSTRTAILPIIQLNPQRTSFAGISGGGRFDQIIPPEKPWPAYPSNTTDIVERIDEIENSTKIVEQSTTASTKSPLEYNPQRPSFAGTSGGGHFGQIIPPGKPWPAYPPNTTDIVERIDETESSTKIVEPSTTVTTKSPLEYNPQRPSFAGASGGGHFGQIVPPGKPWPAYPPNRTDIVERIDEIESSTQIEESSTTTTTKSPLEYNPQRPSFAGTSGGGHFGQIIPPGKPWPAYPPNTTDIVERIDEIESSTQIEESSTTTATTKSPLEYNPQRPSFAGTSGGGHFGQIIPPGKPWPAYPPNTTDIVERIDEIESSTKIVEPSTTATTKSPLEYNPQRPSFAGTSGGGHFGQIIPPGKPWPAYPPNTTDIVERIDEIESSTQLIESSTTTSTKSPLEYNPQRPSFAGTSGGGHFGQIIPPGKPWPAYRPNTTDIVERIDEIESSTKIVEPSTKATTKSPLEYKPQRPSFAGISGGGHFGQIIPPGKPWPAYPPNTTDIVERIDEIESSTQLIESSTTTSTKSPLEYNPQRPSFAGTSGGGHFGQIIPPGKPWPAYRPNTTDIVERIDEIESSTQIAESSTTTSTKSPLEYNPQRPSFAGISGGGHFGQIIPPGKPWPAYPPNTTDIVERIDEIESSTQIAESSTTTSTKSPLEYNPQRPSFAGILGGGHFGQIIPPGKPWPAYAPNTTDIVERIDEIESSTQIAESSTTTSTKSPLVYNPQRPSFAGISGGGHFGQIIPPGKPWPAYPPNTTDIVERMDEIESSTQIAESSTTTSTKSPLEYNPQRPSFAGTSGGGHFGQIIPPGKPWPAYPPNTTDIVERIDEIESSTQIAESSTTTSTKSPLECNPQRPSFAGISGGGHFGQIIPPGKPWPAYPPNTTDIVERIDEIESSTQIAESSTTTSTKSPLEYNPQRPSFAGISGGGHFGQIIPPGKPWPAYPPNITDIVERIDEIESSTQIAESSTTTSTKSPLEYNPQRPSFAGISGGGHFGQIIPPGKPWPAYPPNTTDIVGRIDEIESSTQIAESSTTTSTKSPLEYNPQRPSFAGTSGGGHFGQIIPPGKPWPAYPPNTTDIVERIDEIESSTQLIESSTTTSTKSPLEYNPQRPSFAGTSGGGHFGQIIPPGKPWPAYPPNTTDIVERIDEIESSTQLIESSTTTSTKSPLEYNPQRPSFAGTSGGGHFGQIIPPGKPWPAYPPNTTDIVERIDEIESSTQIAESSTITSTKSPLEYNPQRPSFAGILGGGHFGQIIPPGKPWPAYPPNTTDIVERIDEIESSTQIAESSTTTSTKSPLEYNPQRPSFAGISGGGHFGQIIPPGKPWPAYPPNTTDIVERIDDSESSTKIVEPSTTTSTKSPLEYNPQRPSFAGISGGGHFGQIIPPGKPWPAYPPNTTDIVERIDESESSTKIVEPSTTTSTKSPLEYNPQRPSFAGTSGGGHFGQIIPPGKPWPAYPPNTTDIVERIDESESSTKIVEPSTTTSAKSPLEYNPQRPSFAGISGGGHFGQIIPPGKPWPAYPPNTTDIVERIDESESILKL